MDGSMGLDGVLQHGTERRNDLQGERGIYDGGIMRAMRDYKYGCQPADAIAISSCSLLLGHVLTREDASEILRIRSLLDQLIYRVLHAELLVELGSDDRESTVGVVGEGFEGGPVVDVFGSLYPLRNVC
jgi:hypothetical protein